MRSYEKSLNIIKFKNDFSELKSLEEELQTLNQSIQTLENIDVINDCIIEDSNENLVWSGESFKNFGISFFKVKTFEKALESVRNKKIQILGFRDEFKCFSEVLEVVLFTSKNEFETKLEFEKRKKIFEINQTRKKILFEKRKKDFENDYREERIKGLIKVEKQVEKEKSDILNSWLGEQHLDMKYEAELEQFYISMNSKIVNFCFIIDIPRRIAESFKENVKSVNCLYKYNQENDRYDMVSIYKKFNNRIFQTNLDYNMKDIVIINGLMYQNQLFEDKFTWEGAKSYAKKLRLEGFDDWRLPTANELKNILKTVNKKYVVNKPFLNNIKPDSLFWTAEEKSQSYALAIDLKRVNKKRKLTENLVLCVR